MRMIRQRESRAGKKPANIMSIPSVGWSVVYNPIIILMEWKMWKNLVKVEQVTSKIVFSNFFWNGLYEQSLKVVNTKETPTKLGYRIGKLATTKCCIKNSLHQMKHYILMNASIIFNTSYIRCVCTSECRGLVLLSSSKNAVSMEYKILYKPRFLWLGVLGLWQSTCMGTSEFF